LLSTHPHTRTHAHRHHRHLNYHHHNIENIAPKKKFLFIPCYLSYLAYLSSFFFSTLSFPYLLLATKTTTTITWNNKSNKSKKQMQVKQACIKIEHVKFANVQ